MTIPSSNKKCFHIPGSRHSFSFCNRKVVAGCIYCGDFMCREHIALHNCGNGNVFSNKSKIKMLDGGRYASS